MNKRMMEKNKANKPVLLVFPFNLMAHYLRCLELAKSLRPFFTVMFAESVEYKSFIQSEGFDTFQVTSLEPAYVLQCTRRFSFEWMNEQLLEPIFHDQVQVIRQYDPVAVLGDTSITLKMAAEKTGVLFVNLQNAYMSRLYAHTRKLSVTFPWYSLLRHLPESVLDPLIRKGEKLTFDLIHKPFQRIRRRNGLRQMSTYLDELEGDINLICDLQELFPMKPLPGNYIQIAPLFYKSLQNLSAPVIPFEQDRKTIYVSMGSSGNWNSVNFLNDSWFRQFNIITTGDHNGVVTGSSVFSLPFVNTEGILPYVDLVISHGGNGTLYQALYFGKPSICYTAHFEQEWNVAALERNHLGVHLNKTKGKERIKDLVVYWMDKNNNKQLDHFKKICMNSIQNEQAGISKLMEMIMQYTEFHFVDVESEKLYA